MFLKISQNSWENTCARVSFLNKVFFIKKETVTQLFSCEFCEISKNTFTHGTPLDEVHDIPNQIKNFLSFWGQMKNVKSARLQATEYCKTDASIVRYAFCKMTMRLITLSYRWMRLFKVLSCLLFIIIIIIIFHKIKTLTPLSASKS